MYRPPAFAVDDVAKLHGAIREYPFATIAVMIDGRVEFAYAPVVLDQNGGPFGTVRFHLAINNPVSDVQEGAPLALSFHGPDAYVSPDWYLSRGMVPTWNYVAVEGRGAFQHVGGAALRQMVVDLSAAAEAKLAPKAPWTIDKVPATKMDMLLNAIVGFELPFDSLEGKFKLSQNTRPEDIDGVARALDQRGEALTRFMKKD